VQDQTKTETSECWKKRCQAIRHRARRSVSNFCYNL